MLNKRSLKTNIFIFSDASRVLVLVLVWYWTGLDWYGITEGMITWYMIPAAFCYTGMLYTMHNVSAMISTYP